MIMIKNRPTAKFPLAESVGDRDWGEEILLVLSPGKYTMKLLKIRKGKKGGLQFHRKKDEASYIVEGEMIIKYANENGDLIDKTVKKGDWVHFPAGCIHQEIAITDVVRIEVSTPHFNDRVRVDSLYGMDDTVGLPTTNDNEIIEK